MDINLRNIIIKADKISFFKKLDKIVANTKQEVEIRKSKVSVSELEQAAYFQRETYIAKDFFSPLVLEFLRSC